MCVRSCFCNRQKIHKVYSVDAYDGVLQCVCVWGGTSKFSKTVASILDLGDSLICSMDFSGEQGLMPSVP